MAHFFTNVIPAGDIATILSTPEIQAARAKLESGSMNVVYTSAPVPASTRQALRDTLGLTLGSTIPMRWIRGDTPAHVDVGRAAFENTYLAYLTDSPGDLIVDGTRYPIEQGSAYVFNEGLNHETVGTGSEPRLLLGPMSERGVEVGRSTPIIYYPTETDALANTNSLGENYDSNYTVGSPDAGTTGGFTSWRVASNSGCPLGGVVTNGDILDVSCNESPFYAYYFLYPAETDTCCQAALDLRDIDYTTRAQVIAGILTAAGPQRKPMSYSQYLSIQKAISAKRRA